MKIWIVHQYAIPPYQAGITRHFSFASYLIKKGHSVTIIAASFDHVKQQENRLDDDEQSRIEWVDGVKFVWLRTPAYKGNGAKRFWNMLAFAYKVYKKNALKEEEKPDLIWGSSPHLFAALTACLLAKRLRVPFILEVRDLWPQSLIDLGGISARHPVILLMRRIESYLYKQADKIISLLPAVAPYMIERGASAEKIVWLPNGAFLNNDVVPLKQKKDFKVLYAGSHGLANNLDYLLDAAKIMQEKYRDLPIQVQLLGDGPQKENLQARVLNESINNVRFLDAVPKTQVYDYLSGADALIILLKASPLFHWGISPNKLFDYMAVARPIVFGIETSHNPVEQASAGLTVSPNKAAEIADALVELFYLPIEARQEMGRCGRNYVEKNHDLQMLSEKLEVLLMTTSASN